MDFLGGSICKLGLRTEETLNWHAPNDVARLLQIWSALSMLASVVMAPFFLIGQGWSSGVVAGALAP